MTQIKTAWNYLERPNESRLHLLLLEATDRMAQLSITNPNLILIDSLNQVLITLFYNFEAYGTDNDTKRLFTLLKANEAEIMKLKRVNSNNPQVFFNLILSVRDCYAKLIALTNSCGLGLVLKEGAIDIDENIRRILTR